MLPNISFHFIYEVSADALALADIEDAEATEAEAEAATDDASDAKGIEHTALFVLISSSTSNSAVELLPYLLAMSRGFSSPLPKNVIRG